MANLFNVHCMLCGRAAGQVRNGAFTRLSTAPPLTVRAGRSSCGYCAGSLYLEAEDSPLSRNLEVFPRVAATQAKRTAARRTS